MGNDRRSDSAELLREVTRKRRVLKSAPPAPASDEFPSVGVDETAGGLESTPSLCNRGSLTMVNGPSAGSVHRLGGSTVVGRSFDCEIRVEHIGISRRHAVIGQEAGMIYVVSDLGSRNGTTVRDRPVATARLKDGDRVGFGPIHFRFTLVDEAEEEALKQRYEHSINDVLTGAINRKHFDDRFIGELAFANRHGTELSLLLLDIDHFKSVNDRLGHQAGDSVLRQLASTVRGALRPEDVFARYGGEEFAILARGIGRAKSLAFAERIRSLIASAKCDWKGMPVDVTASIGVSSLDECRVPNVDQLISLADTRLYAAKAFGRNCCRGAP